MGPKPMLHSLKTWILLFVSVAVSVGLASPGFAVGEPDQADSDAFEPGCVLVASCEGNASRR